MAGRKHDPGENCDGQLSAYEQDNERSGSHSKTAMTGCSEFGKLKKHGSCEAIQKYHVEHEIGKKAFIDACVQDGSIYAETSY